jgi:hypothetical protein
MSAPWKLMHSRCIVLHCCRKEDRLDWMYGSGLQAKQDADKRREDMLLGKAEVALPPEKQAQEVSRVRREGQSPFWRIALQHGHAAAWRC